MVAADGDGAASRRGTPGAAGGVASPLGSMSRSERAAAMSDGA